VGSGGGARPPAECLVRSERKRDGHLKNYNQVAIFLYAAVVSLRNLRVICAVFREMASVDRVTERDSFSNEESNFVSQVYLFICLFNDATSSSNWA
jgi:hypothetical protein